MLDLGPKKTNDARPAARPIPGGWRVYRRLLRYTLQYKLRLAVALLFSIVTAASFGSMLIAAGTALNVIVYAPPQKAHAEPNPLAVGANAAGVVNAPAPNVAADKKEVAGHIEDPALSMAEKIRKFGIKAQRAVRWAPTVIRAPLTREFGRLGTQFMELVAAMRQDPIHAVTILTVVLIGLAAISTFASFLQQYFAASIGVNISVNLGAQMYRNVIRLSLRFFEERSSGEIMARFTNDIFMVNRGLVGVLVRLMAEPIKALTFLAYALSKDVGLTLVGLCVLPPVAFVLIRVGQKVKKSVRRSLEKVASMASVVNESVSGIMVVKGYGMEDYEIGRLTSEIGKLRRYLLQMVKADAIVGPLTAFILMTGVAIFTLISVTKVMHHQLLAGDLLGLFTALGLMLDPVRKLAAVNNAIQTSVASAIRIFEFIDRKPDVVESPNAVDLPVIQEALRFEDVHFSYDGKTEVLQGIDLEVKKGEMVALVGFSGAGKSTIAKLIPRFYDVTRGAIMIDGVNICEVTFQSLRDQIGIVTQDTILFDESVRSNVIFGQSGYSDKQVRQAVRAAHAQDFVEKLTQGYNTMIGESGATLSGGQRQRLAIARALIKDPAILILDEATSNLDSESEQMIQQALDEFVVGRTTIVIAHRLSTIQRAHRIVVMDQGRIVEVGTHQQLLEGSGIYRRLYEIQFAPATEPRNGAT